MKKILILINGLLILLSFSCNTKKEQTPINTKSDTLNSVHSITLQRMEPYFLEQEGRDLFLQNCTSCHTSRYIFMQPDFPRKTWQAEVTKMIEKFHAPIEPDNAKKIVDYLTKIKGK